MTNTTSALCLMELSATWEQGLSRLHRRTGAARRQAPEPQAYVRSGIRQVGGVPRAARPQQTAGVTGPLSDRPHRPPSTAQRVPPLRRPRSAEEVQDASIKAVHTAIPLDRKSTHTIGWPVTRSIRGVLEHLTDNFPTRSLHLDDYGHAELIKQKMVRRPPVADHCVVGDARFPGDEKPAGWIFGSIWSPLSKSGCGQSGLATCPPSHSRIVGYVPAVHRY